MALANHLVSNRFELEEVSRKKAAGAYYGEHRLLCRLLGDYLPCVDTRDSPVYVYFAGNGCGLLVL
jgi:hypothetical protein